VLSRWSKGSFYIVDRRFSLAAAWSGVAAALSLLGLIHSWKFSSADTVMNMPLLDWFAGQPVAMTWPGLFPGWPYAVAYGLIACFLLTAQRWGVRESAQS
jgi:hypothetical protein